MSSNQLQFLPFKNNFWCEVCMISSATVYLTVAPDSHQEHCCDQHAGIIQLMGRGPFKIQP